MEKLPPEICTNIFSYACLDTGYTGRSLSLVSKYIHDTSQSVKLQSISLRGYNQILAFASMVKQIQHPRLHRIQYLSISSDFFHFSSIDEIIEMPVELDIKANEEMNGAIRDILTKVASSLQLLHMTLSQHFTPHLNNARPISLPHLKELTINGAMLLRQESQNNLLDLEPCHKLRHLHITRSWGIHGEDVFGCIGRLAPSLSHLRFSGLTRQSAFAGDLEVALGTDGKHDMTCLPSSVKGVWLQLAPPPSTRRCGTPLLSYLSFMLNLQRQYWRDGRIVLLKAQEKVQVFHDVGDWLDRVQGGEGCWNKTAREKLTKELVERDPITLMRESFVHKSI
jgi:hypothetical protein